MLKVRQEVRKIVSVADMKLSNDPEEVIVTHGLGSCLGLAVYDSTARVGGILHVMMPSSTSNPAKAKSNPYMFVDTAVPRFFDELQSAGASRNRWAVKVAGGTRANGRASDHFQIGKKNYVMLRKVLWKGGVLIDAEDVGGSVARTMYLDIGTGRVWLTGADKEWEL